MKFRADWSTRLSITIRYAWIGLGYERGMEAGEIAEHLGCTRNAIIILAGRLCMHVKPEPAPEPEPVEPPPTIITLAGPAWSLPSRIGSYEIRSAAQAPLLKLMEVA